VKNENFTRMTLEEALKTPDQSDWAKVKATSEEELKRQIDEDGDWVFLEAIDWSKAVLVEPPGKQAISIRLDQDILDYFKAPGSGYQARINRVLRHYMESVRKG
jgi:uncharacterized protein (DUF4415 family)